MTSAPEPAEVIRPLPVPLFTPARPWEAEGARVALVTCLACGAALLLDPNTPVDVLTLHRQSHAAPAAWLP